MLPASGPDAYTPARGRLIVSNGYCDGGCAEPAAPPPVRQQIAGPARHQPQPQPQDTALPVYTTRVPS
ncbi:hypothetical protein C1I98_08380 [Spongiactinospora gelatinilytica]|uniref:Uncharacterized protein n=1 Tax=Spongiactinospora gelatinilytica TaxID=2666298 RepID=A0A2W2INQ1_9ACTN|nr:hypothetical protein C1I98_08380 [Spongiactinospora gelatinilytica]